MEVNMKLEATSAWAKWAEIMQDLDDTIQEMYELDEDNEKEFESLVQTYIALQYQEPAKYAADGVVQILNREQ